MNLFGLSPGELLLIMMVALVVLGPEKLPETAASVGKWIREFRRVTEELSSQFAAENPLAELQRALSLTDEPAGQVVAEEPVVVEKTEVVVTPAVEAPQVGVAPPMPIPQITAPVRSDYFTRPVYSSGIAPSWTHGAVEERSQRRRDGVTAIESSIALEWIHGAPIPIPRSSNGHDTATIASGEVVALPVPMAEVSADHVAPAVSKEDLEGVEDDAAEETEEERREAERELTTISTVSVDGREGQRT